jgi:hypothetical protein
MEDDNDNDNDNWEMCLDEDLKPGDKLFIEEGDGICTKSSVITALGNLESDPPSYYYLVTGFHSGLVYNLRLRPNSFFFFLEGHRILIPKHVILEYKALNQ